jgi:hypothetical protein
VQSVIGQMKAMLAAPVSSSPFVQMAGPAAGVFPEGAGIERTKIRPAITRYRDFLSPLPGCRARGCRERQPDGAAR